MTIQECKQIHQLIANEDQIGAANAVYRLLGQKGSVKDKSSAISVLRDLFQGLLDNDLYLEAAVLQWGPEVFQAEPESVVRSFRAIEQSSMVLFMGGSSLGKTYGIGAWMLLDYLRDPLYTSVKLGAVNEDHLRKNLFAHVATLFRSCSIPIKYEIQARDSDLWMGVKDAGNEFGISGIAFKQSQDTSGQFKGYKAKPVRKKPHPRFGYMGRLRVLGDECVRGDQRVSLSDGTSCRIDKIVNGKIACNALSFNDKTKLIEAKPIIGWRRVKLCGRNIIDLNGVKVTEDHPVYTKEAGYVEANLAAELGLTGIRIDHENLSGQQDANAKAEVDHSRGTAWRFFNISKRREDRKCKDEWVYCIDVEGNNNFFAEGVLVHNCQNWPGGPFKDFNSLIASVSGKDLVKIALAFNPEDVSRPVVQLAEPQDGWDAEHLDTLHDWESKAGWRVCRLDAAKSENVIQRKIIYPGLQTYEGYLSYLKSGGDNSANYWCVDEQTQIMTRRGWLMRDELGKGDFIYTLNAKTGLAEWCKIEGKYQKQFEGKLISMEGRGFSALTTHDHRWPVTNKQRISSPFADKLTWKNTIGLGLHDLIPLSAASDDFPAIDNYGPDVSELIGWVVTDGTYQPMGHKKLGSKVCINQSATANPVKCDRIRALLIRAGANHWEQRFGDMMFFNFSGELAIKIRRALGPKKKISADFINLLTAESLQSLMEGMLLGDGTVQGGATRCFTQKDDEQAALFAMIAARLGYATTTHKRWIGADAFIKARDPSRIGKFMNYVNLRQSQTTRRQNIEFTAVDYSGPIWCPRTKNLSFYARRNGTTYFTGNCFARGYPPMKGSVNTVIPPSWPQDARGEAVFIDTPTDLAAVDLAFMGKDTAQMAVGRWGQASGYRDIQNQFHSFKDRLDITKNKPRHVLQIDQILPMEKHDNTIAMAEEIMGRCKMLHIKPENCALDKTGIGFGTNSHLQKVWGDVFGIAWNEKATERKILAEDQDGADHQADGVMSEMWWALRRWIDPTCRAVLINPIVPTNPIHIELTSRRYKTGKNGIKVEAKEEYKARNQNSPDTADAIVMLVHLVRRVSEVLPGLVEQSQPSKDISGTSSIKFQSVKDMVDTEEQDAMGSEGEDTQ